MKEYYIPEPCRSCGLAEQDYMCFEEEGNAMIIAVASGKCIYKDRWEKSGDRLGRPTDD